MNSEIKSIYLANQLFLKSLKSYLSWPFEMKMTSNLSLICAIFPFQVWNLSEAIKFYQSHRFVISEWIFRTQLFSFEKSAISYCPIVKHEYEKIEFSALSPSPNCFGKVQTFWTSPNCFGKVQTFWTSPKHFEHGSKDTKGKIQLWKKHF